MAEKARQPLPWDMRVLAGKGLVEMPRPQTARRRTYKIPIQQIHCGVVLDERIAHKTDIALVALS